MKIFLERLKASCALFSVVVNEKLPQRAKNRSRARLIFL